MSGDVVGYSTRHVAQIVEDEGLCHAIMDYLGANYYRFFLWAELYA